MATFNATRSANRASRIAEQSLLAGLQPVLMHAQLNDPQQKVGFSDQHWVHLEGPGAAAEAVSGVVYLAIALRNVGSGIAVLQSWYPMPERVLADRPHVPVEQFRAQTRDLYVPPGGLGFWQGALRDAADPLLESFAKAIADRAPVMVDLLYTDMHGGQRTVTRFSVLPAREDRWLASVSLALGARRARPALIAGAGRACRWPWAKHGQEPAAGLLGRRPTGSAPARARARNRRPLSAGPRRRSGGTGRGHPRTQPGPHGRSSCPHVKLTAANSLAA